MAFTEQQKLQIGMVIMEWMGDVFYEPWEWGDEPPEGFEVWDEVAIVRWTTRRALDAAEGAIEAIEKFAGPLRARKDWRPPRP